MATMVDWTRFLRRTLLAPVALTFTTVTLVALALPSYGAGDDDYVGCVTDVTAAGVDVQSASASCAGARYPGALGSCVIEVGRETGIGALDSLEGCERSRRPDEVAHCTVDIHSALLASPSVNTLEHCSRSLLPERYGTCVVDLSGAAELAVDAALERCIRAGYRPWTTAPRQ